MSVARDLRFNDVEADRVVSFFERVLRHTKGVYANTPFLLTDWQRDDIIRPLYGTQRYDEQFDLWVRAYSTAWIELARGNGKSGIAAGMALEGFFDGEEGAEIYGAAEDKDQATIVFRFAKRMVEMSPVLSKRLRVIDSQKRIIDPKTDSFYQVLPRDALGEGSQGFAPHVVVFDEVHVQKTKDMIDALRKGFGKRVQPLMIMLTTAGDNLTGPAGEEHELSRQMVEGKIEIPHRFVYMRNTPPDADPFDEANWGHANPALGDFLSIETLRQEAEEAKAKPSEENLFRRYRLNQWVQSSVKWLRHGTWDANAGLVDEAKLADRECWSGLDVASTSDFTALVHVFPIDDVFEVVARFFLPQAAIDNRPHMRRQLEAWVKQGWITVTDGDVVDDEAIIAQARRDADLFLIRGLGYDPFDARSLVQKLQDDVGITCEKVPQTMGRLSGPTKELERLLGDVDPDTKMGRLRHGGNPVLRWMADNVVLRQDGEGRVKPDKRKSSEKIDGVVALVMALGTAMAVEVDEGSKSAAFLSSLVVTCGQCGHIQPATAEQCSRCGSVLRGAAAAG